MLAPRSFREIASSLTTPFRRDIRSGARTGIDRSIDSLSIRRRTWAGIRRRSRCIEARTHLLEAAQAKCRFACSGSRQPDLLMYRQFDANNQSMRLPVIERQLTVVRQHDGARDGKSETEAGGLIHVPSFVAAHEWFEHGVLARIGNAGTIVLNVDRHAIWRHREADRGLGTEPDRVFDQIGNA